MNKEAILERSRRENYYQDERSKVEAAQSMAFGALGMAGIFIVLFLLRLFYKGGTAYDLFAMYFGFLAVSSIYSYRLLKDKKHLMSSVCYVLCTLVWLILYIWKG